MMRTIIFGDIHGCYDEWQDLLEKLKISENDRLIAVGDMICKGPSSRQTLDLAMSLPNFQCVMGNYEWYLLKIWGNRPHPKTIAHKTYISRIADELSFNRPKYETYLKTMPFHLELPECFVVHAGIRPGVDWNKQDPEDMIHLRTLEPENNPWYESYTRNKLIVHGHWAKQGLVVRDNVIGLDTGCVYGNALSALILSGRQIISVPSRRVYLPAGA